jgi:hypothetical protein
MLFGLVPGANPLAAERADSEGRVAAARERMVFMGFIDPNPFHGTSGS